MGLIRKIGPPKWTSEEVFLQEAATLETFLETLNIDFDYIEPGYSIESNCYISVKGHGKIESIMDLICLLGGSVKKASPTACWFSLSKESKND